MPLRGSLPKGVTLEEVFWPLVPFKEQIKLFLGWGRDTAFGKRYRQAYWIAKRIQEACRASRLHPPGQPNKIPDIQVFVPAGPFADDYYYFLLDLPPGVRASRFNAAFLQDLNTRLHGYKAAMNINETGVWLIVPVEMRPSKPPACVLADLGEPLETYTLPLPLGMTTKGPLWADLAKAPHALFAGATGSGKSTLIHACLHYLLDHAEVWAIDLKMVELNRYEGQVARLAIEPEDVNGLLADLFVEMRRRLTELKQRKSNEWAGERIVLVVDELAEVTLASKDNTQTLLRLSQIGRAAGIHLLLATQRPSVQIVPGDLKANVPLRVAFALPTGVDSHVVLGVEGAEELTPPGDALVLMGHRIVRISTPYFKAPEPEEDMGSDEDLRLVGLAPDARAALIAIDGGCKPTKRSIMENFHWGTERARRALKQLRTAGLLVTNAKDDDEERGEHDVARAAAAAAAGTDGTDGTKATTNESRSSFLDFVGTETLLTSLTSTAKSDAETVVEAMNSGACKATSRAVATHFHWGTRRALAALRAARELLRGSAARPAPEEV